ncbi:YhcN/YlaJ family sporulation lipoprotein [Bacillus massiliglaciei]|uniref:YhcN/YlaJ family sporulation lipoprotein n=1 Tax=Bacillus massiliglaciei TaxID=1816693 RepID=UPI0018FE88E9|nr:YhcN/YlaJ family sporulation lipoprotein [Bacillus massiliglaciei]
MARKLIVMMIVSLIVAGCASKDDGKSENMAFIKKVDPKPMDIIYGMDGDDYRENPHEGLITDIKRTVNQDKNLYDAIVVKKDKEVLVAYKVKHMERFRMKQIEKNLTKKLEKNYPDLNFKVSSDYKIFLEAMRLNRMLKEKDVSDKKARKKFDEIIELKDAMT